MADWNPYYTMDEQAVDVGALKGMTPDVMAATVKKKLSLTQDEVRGHHAESPEAFKIFLVGGGEVRVHPDTGKGTITRQTTRPVLHELHDLHLNNLKGAWTWIADIFALFLIFLSLSGLVMIKGKQGLAGRGKWFLGAGLAIPIAFIIYAATGA